MFLQRFSLRKLKCGLASVLLGMSLVTFSQTVSADVANNSSAISTTSDEISVNTDTNDETIKNDTDINSDNKSVTNDKLINDDTKSDNNATISKPANDATNDKPVNNTTDSIQDVSNDVKNDTNSDSAVHLANGDTLDSSKFSQEYKDKIVSRTYKFATEMPDGSIQDAGQWDLKVYPSAQYDENTNQIVLDKQDNSADRNYEFVNDSGFSYNNYYAGTGKPINIKPLKGYDVTIDAYKNFVKAGSVDTTAMSHLMTHVGDQSGLFAVGSEYGDIIAQLTTKNLNSDNNASNISLITNDVDIDDTKYSSNPDSVKAMGDYLEDQYQYRYLDANKDMQFLPVIRFTNESSYIPKSIVSKLPKSRTFYFKYKPATYDVAINLTYKGQDRGVIHTHGNYNEKLDIANLVNAQLGTNSSYYLDPSTHLTYTVTDDANQSITCNLLDKNVLNIFANNENNTIVNDLYLKPNEKLNDNVFKAIDAEMSYHYSKYILSDENIAQLKAFTSTEPNQKLVLKLNHRLLRVSHKEPIANGKEDATLFGDIPYVLTRTSPTMADLEQKIESGEISQEQILATKELDFPQFEFKNVAQDDLNKTIKQIYIFDDLIPIGVNSKQLTITSKYYRDADVDAVNGDVSYTDWIKESSDNIIPDITGYKTIITNNHVHYEPKDVTDKVIFFDDTDKTQNTKDIHGKFGEAINVSIPENYDVISNSLEPNSKFGLNDKSIEIHLKHKINFESNIKRKVVKYNINLDKGMNPFTQYFTFVLDGYKDLATGKYVNTNWHLLDSKAQVATTKTPKLPKIEHYHLDKNIKPVEITPDSNDVTIDLHYVPNETKRVKHIKPVKVNVSFVDKTGKNILTDKTLTFDLVSFDTIDTYTNKVVKHEEAKPRLVRLDAPAIQGYTIDTQDLTKLINADTDVKLVYSPINKQDDNKQTDNKSVDNKQTDNKQTDNKHVDNKQVDNKQTDNKQADNKQAVDTIKSNSNKNTSNETNSNFVLPDNMSQNTPANEKTKYVTRIITYNFPNGQVKKRKQVAKFTLINGKYVDPNGHETTTFGELPKYKIKGYKEQVSGDMGAITINAHSHMDNIDPVVNYIKDDTKPVLHTAFLPKTNKVFASTINNRSNVVTKSNDSDSIQHTNSAVIKLPNTGSTSSLPLVIFGLCLFSLGVVTIVYKKQI